MIQWHPFAQATRFQRTAWINTFSVYSAMQHKGKEMLENSLNQCFWLTEKDKKEYLTWAKSCLQATENMQSMIDRSFQEVEKHLSDQPPAAASSAQKKSTIASLVLAATQPAPKAASPAKKKASAKSTAASKSTSEEQVKKEAVTAKSDPAAHKKVASPAKKRRAATTKTAKKSSPSTKTGAAVQQTSTPAAKPAEPHNKAAGKERTAEKQAPAKAKENSGAVPKQTP
jgi:hypothetical protein